MENQSKINQMLERYVKNQVTESEQQVVEAMITEEEGIAKQLQLMVALREQLIKQELNQTRFFLTGIESKITSEKEKNIPSALEEIKTQLKYTVEQLKLMFAPYAAYKQLSLQYTQRAAGELKKILKAPENECDCADTNYQLHFELSKPVDTTEEIEIIIEDNKGQEKWSAEYTPDTMQFTVDLVEETLAPGRYYWKFMVEDAIILGSFFVEKEWLPEV